MEIIPNNDNDNQKTARTAGNYANKGLAMRGESNPVFPADLIALVFKRLRSRRAGFGLRIHRGISLVSLYMS